LRYGGLAAAILESVRPPVLILAALLAACSPAPPPSAPVRSDTEAARPDPTLDPLYAGSVERLSAMNQQAQKLLAAGKTDEAAALITAAEPLENRLLAAPRPTLAAMEAASDRDDLYGRMLLANHNYGWARMTFQKNMVRWKIWKPQTEETVRRRKLAEAAMAECDRRMMQ
jgi:hypothetical protein